ncbi:MAG: ATP-binding protein [Ginsengibacter sp.]
MLCKSITNICICISLFTVQFLGAQPQLNTDSLKAIIQQQKHDTAEVNALISLCHQQTQFDSAFKSAQAGLKLARSLKYKKGEASCLLAFTDFVSSHGNFSLGLQYGLQALNIYSELDDKTGVALVHLNLQGLYREAGDYSNALFQAFTGERISEEHNLLAGNMGRFSGHRLIPLFFAEIAQIYVLNNQLDSALYYTQRTIKENELMNGVQWGFPVYLLATIQQMQGKYDLSLRNYRLSFPLSVQNGFPDDSLQIFSGMSTLFRKTGQLDSSLYYAQLVTRSWDPLISEIKNLFEAINNLVQVYKIKGNTDSAFKYAERSLNLKDSIFSRERVMDLQNVTFNTQLKQQEVESAKAEYKNKLQIYALAGALSILLFIAFILWRNNKLKQRQYMVLENQKKETDFQRAKVEQAIEELKSAQALLVQREKMASLGELTAGIAHEIQNPLNFVNNFSEVNTELLAEMNQEIDRGNFKEVKSIANDITDNEQKINHHGKRADSIVKGMLQHSRTSTTQKEPTDINELVDEFLRLSYHGLRAKDKSFNATLETDFDQSIGKINIISQDIGRVLLNLFNNAFYSVAEKSSNSIRDLSNGGQAGVSAVGQYVPTVFVSTIKTSDKIIIKVKDNGAGIPQNILDKIFQPFYTTKPAGEGTGLGLSLSYDIIKSHGGEIRVNTKEGEGAEFVIELPGN